MRPRLLDIAAVAAPVALAVILLLLAAASAGAVERNFAGSAQLDYFWLPAERASAAARTTFDGFTSEVALKLAVDVSDKLSANVKVCHGCHGFELPMGYFDYRVFDELNFRVGRFSPSFGAFNVRHDPANHATSSKPLPYDMGRMLRMHEWNLGVLPSPFPDNGIEIGGTHWFGDSVQMDYASYAVSGFRGDQFAPDIEWSHSYSQTSLLVDNNGRPAVGARMAFTLRVGDANDLTAGASVMYGTWDPENRLAYTIAGGDLAARVGRTQLRFEYLMRRQAFELMPGQMLKYGGSGVQIFDKHGAYMEVERMVSESLTLVGRADGLYRVGNLPYDSLLEYRSWVGRLTGGGTLAVIPGWRVKASAELWAFPAPAMQTRAIYELALHLALVGTF